jgi:hypothetical protein
VTGLRGASVYDRSRLPNPATSTFEAGCGYCDDTMKTRSLSLVFALGLFTVACGDDEDTSLNVAWSFDVGDCASNNVETVRIDWGPQGGATQVVEFPCTDGIGEVGDADGPGSYSFNADGVDAEGGVRAVSYGTNVSFSGNGNGGMPIDITLHPSPADVIVSWTLAGGTCPEGVVLPYYIALYTPPAQPGDPLVDKVTEVQESCSTGEATIMQVAPGAYVVELDSRAVTPAVYGTADLTVVAGENAMVTISLP